MDDRKKYKAEFSTFPQFKREGDYLLCVEKELLTKAPPQLSLTIPCAGQHQLSSGHEVCVDDARDKESGQRRRDLCACALSSLFHTLGVQC